MTDDASTSVQPDLVPAPPRHVPNPWVNRLGVIGFLLLIGGVIDFLVPPAASDQLDGSSIVNFPSMFQQYGLGLVAVIFASALLVAWAVTGAREWRLEHPEG